MKTMPACVLFLGAWLAAAPADAQQDGVAPDWGLSVWSWSISESDVDPDINTGTPFLGERDVYLWLGCAIQAAHKARMDLTGSLIPVAFTPASGVVVESGLPTLDLDIGCRADWFLAGVLRVRDDLGTGGQICMGPNRVTEICDYPYTETHAFVGYATAQPPCWSSFCGVDYVDPLSWGRLKALYDDRARPPPRVADP